MAINLTIRIYCEFVDNIDFLKEYPCFLVKEKEANREHYQGILTYPNKIESLRQRIKTINPRVLGNRAYSVKGCKKNIEDLITYYCKGSKDVPPEVIINTFTVDNIDERHKLYWEVNENIKETQKKSLYGRIFDGSDVFYNSYSCTSHVVKYYIENNKPINEHQIKAIVQLYLCKRTSEYRDHLINRVVNQIEY